MLGCSAEFSARDWTVLGSNDERGSESREGTENSTYKRRLINTSAGSAMGIAFALPGNKAEHFLSAYS
jgi:hypothetical protein